MPVLQRLTSGFIALFRRRQAEEELDAELQEFLYLAIEDKMRSGMSREAATRAARMEMGSTAAVKDHVRDAGWENIIETIWQDVRYAARTMRRSPGFTAVAVLSLAVGIGANTAIFTMLNAIVLKRLPISRPDELMAIAPINSRGLPRTVPMSAIAELQDGPLDHLCAYLGGVVFPVLANDATPQTLTTFVTGQCFDAFGVTPILGRGITDADSPIFSPGAHVAVISHRLWTSAFQKNPQVLGQSMLVNNVPVTVIGVLPQGFVGLDVDAGVDIFTPFDAVLAAGTTRRQLVSYLLGRLRAGQTRESAAAQIEARWPALLEAVLPAGMAPTERTQILDSKPRLITMGTGTSRVREQYVQPLMLVFGLTMVLLVIACINLGGLLLARLNSRSAELSLRLALGGTRRRIAQQMLVESLLLSAAGAAISMPIAILTAVTLASFMPPVNVPYAISFAPDLRVFTVTASIAVAAGLAMTALPLWFAMRRATASHITWDRTIVGGKNLWSRGLLVVQVALALVLLVNATLLTRSLYLLHNGDLGIRTDNILTIKMWNLPTSPSTRSDRASYFPPLLEKIRAIPGVSSVALASSAPRFTGPHPGSPVAWRGENYGSVTTSIEFVSPDYFSTLGIRLLAGRDVSWQDTLQSQGVAVVSESLARALAGNGDVIGRAISMRTMPTDHEYVIVGIAADATQGDPRDAHPRLIYAPLLQLAANNALNPNLVVATADSATVAIAVPQILKDFGRDYAQEIIPLEDLLARAPARERMTASVAGAISAIALLLALIGIHGVLAYSVARRKKEIGVRLAVGATPACAARSVLSQGAILCGLGVAVGLPIAFATTRTLRALIFGISESDPATFAWVSGAFFALGFMAAIAPAIRASRVDPMDALRSI